MTAVASRPSKPVKGNSTTPPLNVRILLLLSATGQALAVSSPALADHSQSGAPVSEAKSVGRALSEQNGEEACENKGLDSSACAAVGCCRYDDDENWCSSGVGDRPCSDGLPCGACCPAGCDGPADASKPECAACMACHQSGTGTCEPQPSPSPSPSPPDPPLRVFRRRPRVAPRRSPCCSPPRSSAPHPSQPRACPAAHGSRCRAPQARPAPLAASPRARRSCAARPPPCPPAAWRAAPPPLHSQPSR